MCNAKECIVLHSPPPWKRGMSFRCECVYVCILCFYVCRAVHFRCDWYQVEYGLPAYVLSVCDIFGCHVWCFKWL